MSKKITKQAKEQVLSFVQEARNRQRNKQVIICMANIATFNNGMRKMIEELNNMLEDKELAKAIVEEAKNMSDKDAQALNKEVLDSTYRSKIDYKL